MDSGGKRSATPLWNRALLAAVALSATGALPAVQSAVVTAFRRRSPHTSDSTNTNGKARHSGGLRTTVRSRGA